MGMRAKLDGRWTPHELGRLQKYYGAAPEVIEFLDYFMNSEVQSLFAKTLDTPEDLSTLTPIESCVPYVNV